jgi:hypothetical protein
MTFSVATTGWRALGIFIIPLWKRGVRGDFGEGKQGEKGYGVAELFIKSPLTPLC